MQQIDPILQNQVWSRVMGAASSSDAPVTDQELLELMRDEKTDCAFYRQLSRRTCGRDARCLQGMAEDEVCHYRKLLTMYYLLVGKCPRVQAAAPACGTCLPETLRSAHEAECRAAARYESIADRWSGMSDDFRAIAADELRHSRQLRSMLCRLL